MKKIQKQIDRKNINNNMNINSRKKIIGKPEQEQEKQQQNPEQPQQPQEQQWKE